MFRFVVCSRTCDFVDRTQQFDLSYVYDVVSFFVFSFVGTKKLLIAYIESRLQIGLYKALNFLE